MKKLKVFLTGAMAFAMMMPMALTGVSAKESDPTSTDYESSAEVNYDTRNVIPDPDNPTDPDWGVQIPESVKLTKDTKAEASGVDVSVSLVAINGGTITKDPVDVYVRSANGYQLDSGVATNRKVAYAVKYETVAELNTTTNGKNFMKIATLKDSDTPADVKLTEKGKAYLLGTATKTTAYKDTLVYVVTTNGTTPTNP
ncbi:hypothetical protein [Amedibacillus sp. YH-ame10]